MSLAKLTSLSTQTLSLLLDHQRLKTLPSFSSASPSNTPEFGGSSLLRITRNLEQLRSGILALEAKDGQSEAVKLLRNQYERMRGMLGGEGNVERCIAFLFLTFEELTQGFSLDEEVSFPPTSVTPPTPPAKDTEPVYSRYTDDPEAAYDEPGIMLQTQQRMMNGCPSSHLHFTLIVTFVFDDRARRPSRPPIALYKPATGHFLTD